MPKTSYTEFKASDLFFKIIRKGLDKLVDGEHMFDTIADDASFDFRYRFPGWPRKVKGRAKFISLFSGYGNNIKLRSADNLVVHHVQGGNIVILEYEVHGKVLSNGLSYDNRFISVITIKNRKIVHWRDYMDSLDTWRVLNGGL